MYDVDGWAYCNIATEIKKYLSNDFDIDIEESGTYTVTVTGKKTKGSVKFIVENN